MSSAMPRSRSRFTLSVMSFAGALAHCASALACIGWSLSEQARMLDCSPTKLGRAITKRRVRAGTARAVRDLYERLHMTPALGWRADKARAHAAEARWAPPLGWDDDQNLDDPAEKPRSRMTLAHRQKEAS